MDHRAVASGEMSVSTRDRIPTVLKLLPSPLPASSIHSLFETAVKEHANKIAVTDGESSLTYRELNAQSNRLAHHLRLYGVGFEDCVGICLDRSVQMLVGLLGILKAGAAYMPLDPAFPSDRLKYMIENSGASIVVTQTNLLHTLAGQCVSVICLDRDRDAISACESVNLPDETHPTDLAYVIYTSGSTGQPKGVEVTHGGVVNYLTSINKLLWIDEHDVFMAVTTLSFDISGFDLFSPLMAGGKVLLIDRDTASNGMRLQERLENSDATALQATPATWRMLIDSGWRNARTNTPARNLITTRSLKALCGGEALPRTLADALLLRGVDLWNLYGPTETTIYSTCHHVSHDQGAVPIGRPLDNQSVYVLDEKRQPVPPGQEGEIFVGGAGVARGYRNRPELTAERFLHDPFAPIDGARMYRTGDIGRRRADGTLEYLGRADHQVKMRGFRIELGEIEANLLKQPGVHAAVVVAQERDNGAQRLVGFVAGEEGDTLSAATLRNALNGALPKYMIPAQFVILSSLPLTFNGKIDRKALPLPPWGQPSPSDQSAPADAIESDLGAIYARVLNVPSVGVRDDFFDMGGDSLSAVNLAIQIQRKFNRAITLAEIFEARTVAGMASVLREPGVRAKSKLMTLRAAGDKLPLFCLPGSGGSGLSFQRLVSRLPNDRPVYAYNIPPLDQRPAPLNNLHDYAVDVLAQIRLVCPRGPFHLVGYSFGGTVAFEIAHMLADRGEPLGSLGIIDSWAPGFPRKYPFIQRMKLHLKNVRGPKGTRLIYVRGRLHNFRESFPQRWRRLRRLIGNHVDMPPDAARTMVDILELAELSLNDYQPKPLNRSVDFYRVDIPPVEWPGHSFDDPFNGWRPFVTGELHMTGLPCTHHDVFEEQGIAPLAAAVINQLQTAEAKPTRID
jgi:amino acid adenylation domain-containing protein